MLSFLLHGVVAFPLKWHPAGALPLLLGQQLCCRRAGSGFPLRTTHTFQIWHDPAERAALSAAVRNGWA